MNRHLKLILIIASLNYILGILFIRVHPEGKWVPFIFQQTKEGLITTYTGTILGAIAFIYVQTKVQSKLEKIITSGTMLILMLTNLAIIYLWRISGYYFMYGMDIYNYMGQVRDFISLGHVPQYKYYPNFYPAHPLLHSIVVLVSNLTIYDSFVGFPIITYILLTLILFISLARLFKQSSRIPVIARMFLIMTVPNFLGMFIYPYNQTYAIIIFSELIFFIVYFLQRSNLCALLSFLLIGITLPPAHPIPSLIAVPFLMSLGLAFPRKRALFFASLSYSAIYVWWYFYISSFGLWGFNMELFLKKFIFKTTSTDIALQWTQESAQVLGSFWSVVSFALYNTFPILLMVVIGVVSIKYLRSNDSKLHKTSEIIVRGLFVASLPAVAIYIGISVISFLHNPLRLAIDNPFLAVIVIMAAFTIIKQLHSNLMSLNIRIGKTLLISIALLICVLVPIFNPVFEYYNGLYPSQTKTWQEPLSVMFYEERGNYKYPLYQIGSLTQIDAYISKDLGLTNKHTSFIVESNDIDKIKNNSYLFILRKEYVTYIKLYKGFRYPDTFFKKVSVILDHIYSNHEVNIYGKF